MYMFVLLIRPPGQPQLVPLGQRTLNSGSHNKVVDSTTVEIHHVVRRRTLYSYTQKSTATRRNV